MPARIKKKTHHQTPPSGRSGTHEVSGVVTSIVWPPPDRWILSLELKRQQQREERHEAEVMHAIKTAKPGSPWYRGARDPLTGAALTGASARRAQFGLPAQPRRAS